MAIILTITYPIAANTNVTFHDVTATVMMNSLEPLPQNNFLRKLYTQLFFVPVWIQEDSLSNLSKELFRQIGEDSTLEADSRLKQDALRLANTAKNIYTSHTALKQKVSLEFKIAQLYKGYADYTLYGSINWGAFQGRLYNLREKGIKADWVTYKPAYSPVSLLEEAVLSGSLEKMFLKATPKEYHYKPLKEKLLTYLALSKQGGWGHLNFKGTLNVGKSYTVIPQVRERLKISGEEIFEVSFA